jgi:glycosyltransferase involved in cell wall biosynthesis/SAM-dependent methyltransferase
MELKSRNHGDPLIVYRNCVLCGSDDAEILRETGQSKILKCRSCGLVYRNPILKDAVMLQELPGGECLAGFAERQFNAQRRLLEHLLRRAGKIRRPPGRLLDLGCGPGMCLRVARELGWDAMGIDPSPRAVEYCLGLGLNVVEGTLATVNPEPESFDIISMIEVLGYLPDPNFELRKVFGLLKPGGVLLVRSLNLDFHLAVNGIFRRYRGAFGRLGIPDPSVFHTISLSPRTLGEFARRASLRPLEAFPCPMAKSDPFGYAGSSRAKKAVYVIASFLEAAAGAAFRLSCGKCIISSTFGALCEKTVPPQPIRLLCIITRLDLGGSAADVAHMVKHIDRTKFEIHLMCGSVGQLSEAEITELRAASETFTVEPELRRDPSPRHDLKALWNIHRFIRRGKFHIVHTHTSKAGFIGRLAARLARAPVIVHSTHGHVFYGYFGKLKTKMFIVLEKISARYTDKVLCLTPLEIEDHIKLGIGRRALFDVMESGVPIERFVRPEREREAVRREIGVPADAPAICVIARLDPVKGVRYAIEALAQLDGIAPAPHLILAGDGPERAALEALAAAGGLRDRVHFLGLRRDVPDILHACDVFMLPSLNEGYGKAIVEAMSAGLPVVASNVGGVPFLVKDGVTGLLVPAAAPESLAAAARKIISSPELAERLACTAKKSVSEDLGVPAMLRKLENIYINLLLTGGRKRQWTTGGKNHE